MRVQAACAVLSLAAAVLASKSNLTKPLTSENLLSAAFVPPPVFKNVNLVRIISLEKACPRESVNVVIENVAREPQTEYYIPFTSAQMQNVGGLEVRDKRNLEQGLLSVEATEIEEDSTTQYYKITLPAPLQPTSQMTLSIAYNFLLASYALPASIDQNDKQFLVYEFSAYWPSSYESTKQKTEVKFLNSNVPEYTEIDSPSSDAATFPVKSGSKLTYGPFDKTPAGASEAVRVRYEFTSPVIHVSRLERDIEVSHWGGNAAFEERYTLHNRGANLSTPFSRVKWAQSQFANTPVSAITQLRVPLRVGSLHPYYTDVIGNVSTSRFRSNKREANLELKPRYPVFGGWNYPFRIGWDADLGSFLRKVGGGSYLLKVPFLEGPKMAEGVEYSHIELRVILPEGAR
jgi:oligosaccharyltransferase complex subunit alpha (ribophorin I)